MVCTVLGYYSHKIERPTREVFGDGDINRLASYTEGTLLLMVGFQIIRDNRRDPLIDWILSAFFVGGGTVLGYIEEQWRGKR
jgi:hypothetical protein